VDYQTDSRNHRSQEVRVGEGGQEVASFQKVGLFVHNLRGDVGGLEYQLKRAAPWNGFRYQLCAGSQVLATATRHRRMHAFEPDRPLVRHTLVEFQLDVAGRLLQLIPEDRYANACPIEEAGRERGRLAKRSFDDQTGGDWEADLAAPDGWSVPLAAFVAWLARESRDFMSP